MAKRDPEKTARNRAAAEMRLEMDALLPQVLQDTGCVSLASLNAKIGSKHEQLVGVKERCIRTSDEFLSLYLDALAQHVRRTPVEHRRGSAFYELARWYQTSDAFREYIELFLVRSFITHYDEYSRVKPPADDATYWIGQNNADYGLLITPRFRHGDWENDKSEIRKFKPAYYTIGHVLESGLVIPGQERRIDFSGPEGYLGFFQDTLVRHAGSVHQDRVAERYTEFVLAADDPTKVPLLIPELRYRGRDRAHKHRLDFCVIDPYTLQKIGFEMSPWSSHGQLKGTKAKLVKDVNEEAWVNYERDVRKCEAYFREYGIHVTVFTDSDLAEPAQVFRQIRRYLKPDKRTDQLLIYSKRQLLEMDLDAEVEDD